MTKHNRWRSVYMQSMRHVLKSNIVLKAGLRTHPYVRGSILRGFLYYGAQHRKQCFGVVPRSRLGLKHNKSAEVSGIVCVNNRPAVGEVYVPSLEGEEHSVHLR